LNRLLLDRGFHIDLERSCWSSCNIEWWDGESHNTHSVKSSFISHLSEAKQDARKIPV
jgi:hypothetical protein